MTAPVRPSGSTMTVERPSKLFSVSPSLVIRRTYDVTRDGQRFVIPVLDERVRQTITVVPRWAR
jgi:hypothetical protein